MNAELDGTLGPILKQRADRAGVIYTISDGDQPGVMMNLYRFVKGIGVRPVLIGNIKGLHDPYRNPTTQEGFARQWGQKPHMVTSFADGTKISFEQALLANATGMRVAKRGMHGPTVEPGTRIEEAATLFDPEELLAGARDRRLRRRRLPQPGRLRARHALASDPAALPQPLQARRGAALLLLHALPPLPLRGAGDGRARGRLRRRRARAGGPIQVEVVATAKVDLEPGDELDGFGGYLSYGLAENADVAVAERLLPMGLTEEGVKVVRPVAKDEVLTYDDVELPEGRLCDELRAEQDALSPSR